MQVLLKFWHRMAKYETMHAAHVRMRGQELAKKMSIQADISSDALLHAICLRWHKAAALSSMTRRHEETVRSGEIERALREALAPPGPEHLLRGWLYWRTTFLEERNSRRQALRKKMQLFCMTWAFEMVANTRMGALMRSAFALWHSYPASHRRMLGALRQSRVADVWSSGGCLGFLEVAFTDACIHGKEETWHILCVAWSCFCSWALICRRSFKMRLEVAYRQNRDLTLLQTKDFKSSRERAGSASASISLERSASSSISPKRRQARSTTVRLEQALAVASVRTRSLKQPEEEVVPVQ